MPVLIRVAGDLTERSMPYTVIQLLHDAGRDNRIWLGSCRKKRRRVSRERKEAVFRRAYSFNDEAEEGSATDFAKLLASVKQGDELRRLAEALDIPMNEQFGGLIQTAAQASMARSVASVEFLVVGPRRPELIKLGEAFDSWLEKQPHLQRTAASLLAALDDESVANLSSIVLLARGGSRTILLTGDARSDKVMEGLRDCGVCGHGQTMEVDILKMPHHGSIRNLDSQGDFLARVTSRNYVFSGNGEHGNPDRDTLELLFKARPGAEMKLYFTYPLAEIDSVRRRFHERERSKKLKRGKAPGPEWSDETHSLSALLAQPPAGVTVIQDGPLLI